MNESGHEDTKTVEEGCKFRSSNPVELSQCAQER